MGRASYLRTLCGKTPRGLPKLRSRHGAPRDYRVRRKRSKNGAGQYLRLSSIVCAAGKSLLQPDGRMQGGVKTSPLHAVSQCRRGATANGRWATTALAETRRAAWAQRVVEQS